MRDSSFLGELVPLYEATAVVHHVIAEVERRRLGADDLVRLRRETALALGALAPVLTEAGGAVRVLTLEELEACLAHAASLEAQRESLSALYIRRAQLIRAVDVLKEERLRSEHPGACGGLPTSRPD